MTFFYYIIVGLISCLLGILFAAIIDNISKKYNKRQELKKIESFNIDNVKEITQEVINEQAEKQLIRIQENIIEEAKKGYDYLDYHNFIHDSTKEKLRKMGFTVSDKEAYLNYKYVRISWNNEEVYINDK